METTKDKIQIFFIHHYPHPQTQKKYNEINTLYFLALLS